MVNLQITYFPVIDECVLGIKYIPLSYDTLNKTRLHRKLIKCLNSYQNYFCNLFIIFNARFNISATEFNK